MKRMIGLPILGLAALGLAACNGSDDDDRHSFLRAMHASADAPAVNVLVDEDVRIERLDFGEASDFLRLRRGERELQVDGILPETRQTVIEPLTLDLQRDREYTVIALGALEDIEPLLIENPRNNGNDQETRLQVVHAAADAPEVSVFLTEPEQELADLEPAGSFSFRDTLGPLEVPAAAYRIRVTAVDEPETVLFDSGQVDLAAGNLVLVAIDNPGPWEAPIRLVALQRDESFAIFDRDTQAQLRAVHVVADAPAVDVVANDDFDRPLLTGLAFPEATDYLDLDPAEYNLKITPADNAGSILVDADLSFDRGRIYSLLATGSLGAIEPLLLTDDPRPIATAAKVRLIHGAPSAGEVDIYVTAPRAGIDEAEPALTDVAFRDSTDYLYLAEGEYEVTVTPAGTTDAAIGPLTVDVETGGVYTAIARDAEGGGAPFDVILLDEFEAAAATP